MIPVFRGYQLVTTVVLQSQEDPSNVVQVVKVYSEGSNELNYNVNRFNQADNSLTPIKGEEAIEFVGFAFPVPVAPAAAPEAPAENAEGAAT